MHIGIDFDNTIVCYDQLFLQGAIERQLVPENFKGGKRAIRDAIRRLPDGNWEWTKLQAYAYGAGMRYATPFPGVVAFIDAARESGAQLSIISHKSRYAAADPGGVDLRIAAQSWLRDNGITSSARVPAAATYFEDTIDDKLARIAAVECSHYIDDLEEVLLHPNFPAGIRRLLFANDPAQHGAWKSFSDWCALSSEMFADQR